MAVKQKVVSIDTQQAQTSVKDLRMQLKELRTTMLNCEEGTEEYNKALTQAAEITHTLKEQTEFINATAMDFGQIASNCTKAVGGLVGGLLAAKATMSLFGIENEEVLKSLQKMQNLMAITQALPAIDNGIKAFKKLGIAIKAASVAVSGFSKALIASGIGLAVVAIGLLIANWDKLTGAVDKEAEAEKKRNQEKLTRELEAYNNELKRTLDLREKIAGIKGDSDLKIAKQTLSTYAQAYNIVKELRDTGGGDLLGDEFTKLNNPTLYNIALQNAEEASNKLTELLGTPIKITGDNIQSLMTQYGKLMVEQNKTVEELEQIEKAEKDAEAAKKAAEALETLKAAYKKLAEEIRLYGKTDEEKEIIKLNDQEAEKKKILEDSWKKQIITEEDYQKQLTLITEQYEILRTEVTAKYAKERKDKADQDEKDRLDKIRKEVEKRLAIIEFGYGQQILLISEKELELSEQYKNGGLSSEEYAEALILSQEEQLLSYIDMLNKELEVENITAEEKLAIQQRLTDAKIQLNELQVQNAEEAAQREIDRWSIAANAIGGIFNSLGDLMEEGSKEQKAMQIMGATINMLAGITAAIAGAFTTHSGPWDIALAAIQATAIAASGAATIAKMAKTNKSNASGSASSAKTSASALTSIVAPVQYTQDVQGAAIEGSIKDQKVYVVESDITNAQKKVSVAESEAQY